MFRVRNNYSVHTKRIKSYFTVSGVILRFCNLKALKVNSHPSWMIRPNVLFKASVHESLFAGGAFVADRFQVHLFHVTFYVPPLLATSATDQTHIA